MASMAGRSTMVRTLCRRASSTTRRISFSLGQPFRSSNLSPRQNSISTPLFLRRELSSFQPLHTAIASSYLVSKLSSYSTTSIQGRFANYISPI